jgi:two-component system OmpR family response regulator
VRMDTAERRLIAVVEDDREILRLVSGLLTQEGYDVAALESGPALSTFLAANRPDLLVLDWMLPGEDGLSICRRLRASDETLPIIMLTAKSDEIDRVLGLEIGADDYLAKPFAPRELLARIRAVLRRSRTRNEGTEEARRYAFAGLVIDLDTRSLGTEDGAPITLTSGEFALLACFVQRPRRVLSREQLLDLTRGRDAENFDRSIDMVVSRLRKKLDAATGGQALITTVRNSGYLFVGRPKRLTTP